jgi:cation transport ATPase
VAAALPVPGEGDDVRWCAPAASGSGRGRRGAARRQITISRGTLRKIRQNLAWAAGYNSVALPIAAGLFKPLGLILRPEVGAISMSGSSLIVAVNALALKRLRIPRR